MSHTTTTDSLLSQRRRAVATTIGQLNGAWAYLEFTIDGCISFLHDFFGGRTVDRYRPRAFGRKVKYLIKGAVRLRSMSFIEPYLPILERIEKLSIIRNWLIHGYLMEINEDQTLKFVRHSQRTKMPKLEHRIFCFKDIYRYTVEIHEFGKVIRELMDKISEVTESLILERLNSQRCVKGADKTD